MDALTPAILANLPAPLQPPAADRTRLSAGIVHLSVGNFHRAHQAWYLDRLLAHPDQSAWAICGVGLLDDAAERRKADAFHAQGNLYTLTSYAPDGTADRRVIGSIVEYLFAPADPEAVLARMSDPAIRIVSLTITEGGYNQDKRTGAYRLDAPATIAELADPARPTSAFGFIVEALRRRRAAGTPAFTVLSCDNLRGNGVVARAAVLAHAGALDPDLAAWIDAESAFPNAMVDRITPATTDADRTRLNAESGVEDLIPVQSEDFAQWVIEDRFPGNRPAFERVGAEMVEDVHAHELAKIRMLNASHLMLAYPAQLAGYARVDQAVADPAIRRLLERFLAEDAIPHLVPPPGMDLHAYAARLLARFSNTAIGDQVTRITGDGAAKLPVFLLPTLADAIAAGADTRRIAFCLACFLRYVGGRDDGGSSFTPFEPNLDPADLALALDPAPDAALRISFLQNLGITANGPFARDLHAARSAIASGRTLAALADLLA